MATREAAWHVSLFLACTVLAGCDFFDRDAESVLQDDEGILAYVPADAAYVFAAVEKMPDETLARLEAVGDATYGAYATVIEATVLDAARDYSARGGDPEEAEFGVSIANELASMMNSASLRAAGIPLGAHAALYGVGLLPVLRIELSNPVAFEAKLAEIEANTGRDMSRVSVRGVEYRYVGNDLVRVIVGVVGDYAVVALAPSEASEEHLARVLGIERPARNVADAALLAQLAERYGYAAYGLGFFDITRLLTLLIDERSADDAALLSRLGFDRGSLSEVCRDEFRTLAAAVPRVISGYTRVEDATLDSNTVVEIRPDLAAGLATLAAPVPGLGTADAGFAAFGMSIDLLAARAFLEERAAALAAEPFRCEQLGGLAALGSQLEAALARPVPPIAYGFRGFNVVIDSIDGIDPSGQQPPEEIDARVIIASENAPGLLALGSMFSPELAAIDLQPDGQPVAVQLPAVAGQVENVRLAMTPSALAMASGGVPSDELAELLASPPAEPLPSFSMQIDGRRYYQFVAEAMRAGAANDAENAEQPAEVSEAASRIVSGFGDLFDRISFAIAPTERGLEMPSTVTLAEPE